MFALAVRHDALPANPAEATATVKRAKASPVSLRATDVARLRAAARDWRAGDKVFDGPGHKGYLLAAVDLILGTGVRISEAMALRWGDVHLGRIARPIAKISATIAYIPGTGHIYQEHPKTASGNRELYLPPFAAATLREFRPSGAKPSDYVFASRSGNFMLPSNLRRSLRSALEDAGLDGPRWSPHKLRVTVGTAVARDGGIDNAAAVLGHAGTEVTRRHNVEQLRRAPDVNSALQALVEATDPERSTPSDKHQRAS